MKCLAFLCAAVVLATPSARADELSDATDAFQHGNLTRAESTLHHYLEAHPANASALTLLAAVLDAQQKFGEAESAYQQALHLAPRSATLLNNFANHQLSTGHAQAARSIYLKVLEIDPGRLNARLQLAAIAVQEKQGAQALRFLQQIPAADREQPQVQLLETQALFLMRRDAEARNVLERLSKGGSGSDPRLSFSTGLALAAIGQYADAEAAFARTADQVGPNFDVLSNLGLAAYHAGHLEKAQQTMEAALAQRPEDVDTLANLAGVENDLNDREKALGLLAHAARVDPKRASVQRSLADTASALGYYADALPAYEQAARLNSKDETARREQAFVMAAVGQKAEGLAALESYVRAHERDGTAHYELGIMQAQSDPAAAARQLDQAVALDPASVPARFGRGILRFIQGNTGAALPDFEWSAKHVPDNTNILDRLGEAYLAQNRAADAVAVLAKAAQLAPADARVWMHLSRAYAKAGQSEQARAALAKFRAIGPDQINRVPKAGFVEFLSLPPEQQQVRYNSEVEKRYREDASDPGVLVRYLKLKLDFGDAAQAREAAVKLRDANPPAPLAAEAARALVDADLLAEAKPLVNSIPDSQKPVDALIAQARLLEASAQYDEANAAFQRAIVLDRNRADTYEQAGLFLARHGRAADGVKLLDSAGASTADSPNTLLVKAGLLIAAARAGDAEVLLKQIEKRWPDWPQPYVTYGILLEGQKRANEAKTQLETAMSLGASGTEAYYYLAKSTLDAAPDQVADAAKAIDAALATAPDDPGVQSLAGRIDYQQKRYDSAIAHLQTAVKLRPEDLPARFTLAQAYRAVGRTDDAARESKEFQRLRAANPNADAE